MLNRKHEFDKKKKAMDNFVHGKKSALALKSRPLKIPRYEDKLHNGIYVCLT